MLTLFQVTFVKLAHPTDAKLVAWTDEFHRTQAWRIKRDVFDGRAQAVVRNIEVNEGAAHEDAGGVDFLIECVFAVGEEYGNALSREQAGTLKPGESGADDGDIVVV